MMNHNNKIIPKSVSRGQFYNANSSNTNQCSAGTELLQPVMFNNTNSLINK